MAGNIGVSEEIENFIAEGRVRISPAVARDLLLSAVTSAGDPAVTREGRREMKRLADALAMELTAG